MAPKERSPFRSQSGRINFEGATAARFWIRAFGLDNEIREALQMFGTSMIPGDHNRISTPIIGDYAVTPELTFYYLILATVDRLNLIDGVGVVFYAGPEQRAKVEKVWRKMGDDLVEEIKTSGKPGRFVVFEPTKEEGRLD